MAQSRSQDVWFNDRELSESQSSAGQTGALSARVTSGSKRLIDLTNSGLKLSINKLSHECAAKRPRLVEERREMYNLQEYNEKLSNIIEMLEYSRTESFNFYNEMKESCDTLIDEQKKMLSLIEGTERSYEHVKTFVLTCKYHMDKVTGTEERRKLLYNITLQNIKNKGCSAITEHQTYLNQLENLLGMITAKNVKLNSLDHGPLEEARKAHKQLLENNHLIKSNLEKEILNEQENSFHISEEKVKTQEKINELTEEVFHLKNEINEKECTKLKYLSEERREYENKLNELTKQNDEIEINVSHLEQDIVKKQKEKINLNENIGELNELLSCCLQSVSDLIALEPKLTEKRAELIQVKEMSARLCEEVSLAENSLSVNTSKLNQVLPLKAETEMAVSNLEEPYRQLKIDVETTVNNINKEMERNEEMRKQIKLYEEKLENRESLIKKETEFLQSITSSCKWNLKSISDKLKSVNEQFHLINDETCAMQTELNMMSSELMVQRNIKTEMKERDKAEQRRLITKFQNLKDQLEALDREVTNLKTTKDSLSEALQALTLQNTSQLQEKKMSIEETKNNQKTEVKVKQKELSAANAENNKLCLFRDDINRLILQMNSNLNLYTCEELKLKAHCQWALKQFNMVHETVRKTPTSWKLSELPPINEETITASPLIKDVVSSSLTKDNYKPSKGLLHNIKLRSMSTRDSTLTSDSTSCIEQKSEAQKSSNVSGNLDHKKIVKSLEILKQSDGRCSQDTDIEQKVFTKPKPRSTPVKLNSQSESISPIDQNNFVVINKTPISQFPSPREQTSSFPNTNNAPFFTSQGIMKENMSEKSGSSSLESSPGVMTKGKFLMKTKPSSSSALRVTSKAIATKGKMGKKTSLSTSSPLKIPFFPFQGIVKNKTGIIDGNECNLPETTESSSLESSPNNTLLEHMLEKTMPNASTLPKSIITKEKMVKKTMVSTSTPMRIPLIDE